MLFDPRLRGLNFAALAGGTPAWVLTAGAVPASLDIDFVNDLAYNSSTTTIASLLACTRAAPATTYYTNADGTLTGFATNTLRNGNNGLLVEESRTNLCLRSQDFSNAAWAVFGAGCSKTGASASLAPDGTATAYEVALGTDGGAIGAAGAVYQSISVTSGTTYTGSVYVRAKTGTTSCRISVSSGGIDGSADVSLTTTWQRITVTHTATATVTGNIAIRNNVAGNSGSILVWGAQLEAGSFATSYIPTTSGSQARSADAVSFNTVSWLGAAANTYFLEANPATLPGSGSRYFAIANVGATERPMDVSDSSGGVVRATPQTGGATQATLDRSTVNVGSAFKYAVAFDTNDVASVLNGSTATTDNVATLASTSGVSANIGSFPSLGLYQSGYYRRFAVWNSRVSNANLQTLTSYVLTDSTLDIDFTANTAYTRSYLGQSTRSSVSIASLLTCTRAAPATTYYTTSTGSLISFGANTLRYGDNGLLVEESRANLALRSQEFDNGAWSTTRCSVSPNTATAPDGTLTADTLIEDNTNNFRQFYSTSAITLSAAAYTWSIYVKPNGRTWFVINAFNSTDGNKKTFFNLSGSGSVGTSAAGNTATITALANGWYRCSVTRTPGGAYSGYFEIEHASADNTSSYQGDGASGYYIWGAQLELGAFATSYIPTTTGSVTRNADNISITSPTAINNAATGTFYVQAQSATIDAAWLSATPRIIAANGFRSFVNFTTSQRIATYNASVNINHSLANPATTSFKAANAYSSSARSLTSTGGTLVSDANGFSGLTNIYLGGDAGSSSYMCGYIPRVTFLPTKVGDTNLQTLVT